MASRRARRTGGVVLAVLAALAVALPAAAGDAAFLIETISVEGARYASRGVVVTESRLVEGGSYTERELREAVYRIERLPFVLAADFSLRKGSERGSFELVIALTETTRFFASVDGTMSWWDTYLYGTRVNDSSQKTARPTVGARAFLSSYLEASGGVEGVSYSDLNGFEVSYQGQLTHYNLFGRGLVGTVALADRAGGRYDLDTRLIAPLAGNHSLRLDAGVHTPSYDDDCYSPFFAPDQRYCVDRSPTFVGGAQWLVDSTDDVLVPTTGSRAVIGLEGMTTRVHSSEWENGTLLRDARTRSRSWSATAEYTFFRPAGRRSSFGLGGRLSTSRSRTSNALFPAADGVRAGSERFEQDAAEIFGTGYLPLTRRPESFTAWWLETRIAAGYGQTQAASAAAPWRTSGSFDRLVVGLWVAGRGRWGSARLGLAWHRDSMAR